MTASGFRFQRYFELPTSLFREPVCYWINPMKIPGVTFISLVFVTQLAAHDYWLEPDNFTPDVGENVSIRLFVGDHFLSEKERVFRRKRTVMFQWLAMDRAFDLAAQGREGARPFGQISPELAGLHLLILQRDWAYIELEAERFNKYLEHEGLKGIQKLRREAGRDNFVGKERYRRYLKSLLQVGGQSDETWRRRIGHRLEIVPLTNPYGHRPGDCLTVLLLFDDKPLTASQLEACHRGPDKVTTQTVSTDNAGQATIRLTHAGPWLLRLVHMQNCSDDPKVDWESFWAAYSFGLPKLKK